MNTLEPELERRLNNVVNIGIVEAVNYDNATCTVAIDCNVTDWLPFGGVRMGNVKVWNPPVVGEQVLVMSENGELDTAVVLSSFDYDANPQPSGNPNSVEIHCKDGAKFVYDHGSHALSVNLPAGSSTSVNSGSVDFNCDTFAINCKNYSLNSTSNKQDGELVINGLAYKDHTHKKVTPGGGKSGGLA